MIYMGWLIGLASMLPHSSSQDCHRDEYRSDFWIAIAESLVVGQCPQSVDIGVDQARGIPKPTFLFSTRSRFFAFRGRKMDKTMYYRLHSGYMRRIKKGLLLIF